MAEPPPPHPCEKDVAAVLDRVYPEIEKAIAKLESKSGDIDKVIGRFNNEASDVGLPELTNSYSALVEEVKAHFAAIEGGGADTGPRMDALLSSEEIFKSRRSERSFGEYPNGNCPPNY